MSNNTLTPNTSSPRALKVHALQVHSTPARTALMVDTVVRSPAMDAALKQLRSSSVPCRECGALLAARPGPESVTVYGITNNGEVFCPVHR